MHFCRILSNLVLATVTAMEAVLTGTVSVIQVILAKIALLPALIIPSNFNSALP